jgi:glycerol kinase
MVPAFTGLGAPYWRANVKGAMFGLTRGTTMAHVARAALESIAFQSAALLVAMKRDASTPISELRVDGGASANNMLMQFQADLLGVPVVRPKTTETTALGAAYLAGIACGVYGSTAEVVSNWQVERVFEPQMSADEAAARMARWDKAVAALPAEDA